jgi:hypothetical protein
MSVDEPPVDRMIREFNAKHLSAPLSADAIHDYINERISAVEAENAELRAERDRIQWQYDAALAELEGFKDWERGTLEIYDDGSAVVLGCWAGGAAPKGEWSTLSLIFRDADGAETLRDYIAVDSMYSPLGCHVGRTATREMET